MDPSTFQNQYNQYNSQAGALQNQIAGLQASAKNPNDFLNTAETQLGVGDAQNRMNTARQAVDQTNNLLTNLPGAVQGQVNGTLTTEAQRQALLGQRQQPLMQNYQDQSQNYGDLSNQYQNLLGQATSQAQMGYQGQQDQLAGLQGQYANYANQASQALQAYQQAQAFQAQQAAAAKAANSNPYASLSGGSAGGGQIGTAASTSPQQSLMADIQKLITPDYATRFLPGYTEREIQRLQQAYPEINAQTIAQQVYGYRKQFEQPSQTVPAIPSYMKAF